MSFLFTPEKKYQVNKIGIKFNLIKFTWAYTIFLNNPHAMQVNLMKIEVK